MTDKAIEIGTKIGKAMAADVIAEDMDTSWTGIDDHDGDQLTAAGIEPDTVEWDEAVEAAKAAYLEAMEESQCGGPFTAVESNGNYGVRDTSNAVWWPNDEAQSEIQASDDPEAAVIAMVMASPMRGEWVS